MYATRLWRLFYYFSTFYFKFQQNEKYTCNLLRQAIEEALAFSKFSLWLASLLRLAVDGGCASCYCRRSTEALFFAFVFFFQLCEQWAVVGFRSAFICQIHNCWCIYHLYVILFFQRIWHNKSGVDDNGGGDDDFLFHLFIFVRITRLRRPRDSNACKFVCNMV